MAYHGYIPLIKRHLYRSLNPTPTLLEVGVDRGVTFIPLVVFLARTRASFTAVGVDILCQEQVTTILSNIDVQESSRQVVSYVEDNSLRFLPELVSQGRKFDVILIDGDHNYSTVAQELQMVDALARPNALVVVDDYHGRWSERDLFYSERPGYENVAIATTRVDSVKHGVKPAVDEWLAANPHWTSSVPINGEPILLQRR